MYLNILVEFMPMFEGKELIICMNCGKVASVIKLVGNMCIQSVAMFYPLKSELREICLADILSIEYFFSFAIL